jgi:Na+-transporting NADH:ubiquinone oxidoreductase subunit A
LSNVRPHSKPSRPPGAFGGHRPSPLIPTAKLESALPYGLPVVPLMRALSVGDAEVAERLGCLDLIEEDVALLSSLCTSGSDYGQLLRRVLDELEDAA